MSNVVFIDETKDNWRRVERMRAAHRRAHQERINRRTYVQYYHGEKPLIVKVKERRVIDVVFVLGGLIGVALLLTLGQ
jgi:hypothetical protein